ncbi:hypothetical protein LCGC14_0676900 [marine sediment metagenome]|uniref:Uncharacterized protein n=1 Tax=marine sediment metagenome TaxID=412755 RepID=A0A0F9QUG4_9ZZZZ
MKQYPPYEADNPPGAPLVSRRRQVKGTKPRVKRYSLEELYELGRKFGEEYSYVGPYQKFLDWLEEQA